MINRLCVFDFDGTLFRSPEKPSWWPALTWWTHRGSLESPCVPDVPDSDWWVAETAAAVHAAAADPGTVSVLLTGRDAQVFHGRLHTLLADAGLHFDRVLLCDSENTLVWKTEQLRRLITEYSSIWAIEAWEDRDVQLEEFREVARASGLAFESHLVSVEPHAIVAEPATTPHSNTTEAILARFLARNG